MRKGNAAECCLFSPLSPSPLSPVAPRETPLGAACDAADARPLRDHDAFRSDRRGRFISGKRLLAKPSLAPRQPAKMAFTAYPGEMCDDRDTCVHSRKAVTLYIHSRLVSIFANQFHTYTFIAEISRRLAISRVINKLDALPVSTRVARELSFNLTRRTIRRDTRARLASRRRTIRQNSIHSRGSSAAARKLYQRYKDGYPHRASWLSRSGSRYTKGSLVINRSHLIRSARHRR